MQPFLVAAVWYALVVLIRDVLSMRLFGHRIWVQRGRLRQFEVHIKVLESDVLRIVLQLSPNSKGHKMRKLLILIMSAAVLGLTGCGYNTFQNTDEQVKASWAEVLNQYQRRSDLVPNLVSTVKGESKFEQDTLTKVVEARSKATSVQASPELINDPAAFQKFQQAQGQLTGALSRLLMVSENYPNLKANQAFRDLQAQLEGTENRIAVARNRFIKSVQEYNVTVRSFPSNLTAMVFGYKEKANFTVENEKEISKPPVVSFDNAPVSPQNAATVNRK